MASIDISILNKYLDWMKLKLFLNNNAHRAKHRRVFRGEVYWCELGRGIGSEESKKRPCVILQDDVINRKSPNTLVAPITHTESPLNYVIPIADQFDSDGKLILDGHVLVGNMVCISKARLGNSIGKLTASEMKLVDTAISTVTGIKKNYDTLNRLLEDQKDYNQKLKAKISDLETQLKIANQTNEIQKNKNL